jgi:spermidine synthase
MSSRVSGAFVILFKEWIFKEPLMCVIASAAKQSPKVLILGCGDCFAALAMTKLLN